MMLEIDKKIVFAFSVLSLLTFNQVCGFRILGIFPHIGKSHSYAFLPLMKELALRGHEVTVISHFPTEDPPKNYRDISLHGTVPFWESFDLEWFNYPYGTDMILRHVLSMQNLFEVGIKSCEAMLKNQEVLNLKEGDFDVAIIEQFNSDCGLGIIHKMKVPFIGITSHVMMPWTVERSSLIDNPSYVPSHFLKHGRNPGVFEIIESMVLSNWYKLAYYYFLQKPERDLLVQLYDKDTPALGDVAKNMSMVMVYTYFPLTGAIPMSPNAIEIGGIHHQKKKNLDQDLQSYLDNSKNGVILFTMGSMLRSSSWPEDKLKAFQDAFETLSTYNVIWKWDQDSMQNKPKNVKLVKWLPQFEVLSHENVKVFITHAGMLGLSEAIHNGVPVVTIPIYGDQFCNAGSARDSGVGAYLEYKEITNDTVVQAITNMLDPIVQERSNKLAEIWKDRPSSALQMSAYWVEHIAKYGGEHLRPTHANLPWYRYLLLDVFIVLIVIISIILYVNYLLCLALCRWRSSKKRKVD